MYVCKRFKTRRIERDDESATFDAVCLRAFQRVSTGRSSARSADVSA